MRAIALNQRLVRGQAPSYERLQARFAEGQDTQPSQARTLHCGWGRLLIGHTFANNESLAGELLNEAPGERDIAIYIAAPHQVLAQAPQQLFLDPSDTLRLWFTDYRQARSSFRGFQIRRVQSKQDWEAVNGLFLQRGMLPVDADHLSPSEEGGPS